MEKLFKRNYQAVVNRGLIKKDTRDCEFYAKLIEEEKEVGLAFFDTRHLNEEIADCLVVCANWLIHRGVSLTKILAEIAEKNEKRAING